ncbi:phage tail tape measure protein [Marinomonas posidonica]|uniref:phage tail tape measure protein n=1 Tax=Marinomonas posidonica TaxID=936476 RepID=UPI003735034B
MARGLDRLMLTIGLLDRITAPMKGIQRTIKNVTDNSRKAFMNTAAGVTALIAASTSFASTVNPANDMNNALNEVRSLEVADQTLARLNQAGLKYSIEFGDQAAGYVRSAYDIQSAIDGLVDNDLPRFTTAAGTLAKATKANVTDITSYFGSMYGIFKRQANEMGKGTWVEMLAGQTAKAVQMFKTTGPEMSAAFESIGADAATMGVKLHEQMAVLGTLQATMSGSESGTKYGAFLEGLANAQGKLGLSFTDESGQLLPIVEILEMINTKTKGLNALEVQDVLSDAFGSDQAVSFIKLMSNDIGKLSSDIDKLGNITSMQKAIDMAKAMRDPFAQVAAGIRGVSIAVWQKALPAINPFIDSITSATLVIVEWTDKYPHLTKAIGLAATAFIAFVAIAGLMSIAIGLARYAMVGLTMRFIIVKPIVWGAQLVMKAWTASLWLARTALLAYVLYGPALAGVFMSMKTGILTSLPAIWAFTAALLANPLTWIVVGVVALIAALVALVVYWDDVTAAVKRFFSGMSALANTAIFEPIQQWWGDFQVWLGSVSFMPEWDLRIDLFESIKQWWVDFKNWLNTLDPFAFLGDKVDWLKQKLSWIPGIDVENSTSQEVVSKAVSHSETVNSMVSLPGSGSSQSSGDSGGLFQSISNMFGGSKKSVQVEKIEVNNHGQGVRGDELMYQLEMEAG